MASSSAPSRQLYSHPVWFEATRGCPFTPNRRVAGPSDLSRSHRQRATATQKEKRRYIRSRSRPALSAPQPRWRDRTAVAPGAFWPRFESRLARALAERRVARVAVRWSTWSTWTRAEFFPPLDRWLSVFACPLSEPPPAPVPVRRPPARSMPCGKASSRRPPSPRPPQSLRIRSGALSQTAHRDRAGPYTAKERRSGPRARASTLPPTPPSELL